MQNWTKELINNSKLLKRVGGLTFKICKIMKKENQPFSMRWPVAIWKELKKEADAKGVKPVRLILKVFADRYKIELY